MLKKLIFQLLLFVCLICLASCRSATPDFSGNVSRSGADVGNGSTDPNNPKPEDGKYEVPGENLSDSDIEAINVCMEKWGPKSPFGKEIKSFKKISASVTVMGIGNALNDTERTSEPKLILVEAGVNVLGTVKYNMMNVNGYYCLKVGVNVSTKLNIDLHCNARLADSSLQVNVGGSNSGETTTAIGVNVLATVTVNNIRPSGDPCVR